MFSVYLQTTIVFRIVLSTIIGEVGTVSITGIDRLGITIIETIDGVIMVNRDMTVIVITLVGIEVMDLSGDLTKVMDLAEDPIKAMDLSGDLTKVMDLRENLIEVMAVIMAINDKL
jgi:hypothetical protein